MPTASSSGSKSRWRIIVAIATVVLAFAWLVWLSELVVVERVQVVEVPEIDGELVTKSHSKASFTVVEFKHAVEIREFRISIPGAIKNLAPGKVGSSCLGTFIEDGSSFVTSSHCFDIFTDESDEVSIKLPYGGFLDMSCTRQDHWETYDNTNDDCEDAEIGDWAICRALSTSDDKAEKPIPLASFTTRPNSPVALLQKSGIAKLKDGSVPPSSSVKDCFGVLPAKSLTIMSGTGLITKEGNDWKLLAVYSGGDHEPLFSSVLHDGFQTLMDQSRTASAVEE